MSESDCLNDCTEWIGLKFVERERTPREIIEKTFATTSPNYRFEYNYFYELDVRRSRTVVHNWVQKADLQPVGGERADRVAVDQKSIRVNNEEYWLYAAVDLETNRILHARLFPTYTIPIGREFLTELCEKHDVSDALFLVDDAADLAGALRQEGLEYRVEIHGYRDQVSSFSNCFSNADPLTAETWVQAYAV